MKKCVIALLAAMVLTACEKTIESEDNVDEVITTDGKPVVGKRFIFTVKGDFSEEWKPVTRGYLAADGKDMTDLWLFDYVDGQLVQQLHQGDNTAENFGKPQMTLSYGSHHIYFVASRGVDPVLNTTNATITWSSVRDTFWKGYEVNVVSTSNGNRAVTLDRVVTKLRLTFTDEVPAEANSISIVPHTWYYGLDYTTGQPASAQTDASTVITIPDASKGQTGIQTSLFGFSGADEWNTDVVISSRTATDTVLGSATISAAPFKANRVSDYQGPLFGTEWTMTLSLNSSWDDAYNGTW